MTDDQAWAASVGRLPLRWFFVPGGAAWRWQAGNALVRAHLWLWRRGVRY